MSAPCDLMCIEMSSSCDVIPFDRNRASFLGPTPGTFCSLLLSPAGCPLVERRLAAGDFVRVGCGGGANGAVEGADSTVRRDDSPCFLQKRLTCDNAFRGWKKACVKQGFPPNSRDIVKLGDELVFHYTSGCEKRHCYHVLRTILATSSNFHLSEDIASSGEYKNFSLSWNIQERSKSHISLLWAPAPHAASSSSKRRVSQSFVAPPDAMKTAEQTSIEMTNEDIVVL